MKRAALETCWLYLRVVVTSILTLAIFNFPRTWWQEMICATSLIWSSVFVVALLLDFARFRRTRWSPIRSLLVVLQIACVVRTVQMVWPYLYATPKVYTKLSYADPVRFLFVDISARQGNAHADALKAFIDIEAPSLIVLTRFADTPILSSVADRYPFNLTSTVENARAVDILSTFPLNEPPRLEYGYAALPAVLGEFRVQDDASVLVGAFDALAPHNQGDFIRSRLTARRMASSLKFATKPRIVLGAFRTPVTSQIVEMYSAQLHLRSLFFNQGISALPQILKSSVSFEHNINIFTARNILISRVIESHADDDGFSAVLFDGRIPLEKRSE
jgi:hypothetical protein